MIICFSGSHSTGKSTLVEFFKGKEGFVSLDSCTRSTISAEERRIDGIQDLGSTQIKMLDNVSKRMVEIVRMNVENPDKIFLMDRSCLDFIGYSRSFYKRGLLSKEYLSQIEDRCKDLWKYIDIVFYLPLEFSIVDDGVRSLDEKLREDVDKEIRQQIFWNRIRAVELTGSVLTRVETIKEAIANVRNSD